MKDLVEVGSTVLVFGEYEGIILEQHNSRVLVYCPEFSEAEPYLVTDAENVLVVEGPTHSKLVN
jgi:hypothetical protein